MIRVSVVVSLSLGVMSFGRCKKKKTLFFGVGVRGGWKMCCDLVLSRLMNSVVFSELVIGAEDKKHGSAKSKGSSSSKS